MTELEDRVFKAYREQQKIINKNLYALRSMCKDDEDFLSKILITTDYSGITYYIFNGKVIFTSGISVDSNNVVKFFVEKEDDRYE